MFSSTHVGAVVRMSQPQCEREQSDAHSFLFTDNHGLMVNYLVNDFLMIPIIPAVHQ